VSRTWRIGLVVPSSNVTVETELPLLLGRHARARFSFHASRMRMGVVSPEELAAMNAQRSRCVDELADAGVDAVLYGCLVALMAEGHGAHERTEREVAGQLAARGSHAAVTSSAGALLEALSALGAARLALVTPYMRPLAERVVGYLEAAGHTVVDWVALEEADNAAVARIPGERVMAAARALDLAGADALVISACVQMPSLDLVQPAEDELGLPVLSAATAGAWALLRKLGLDTALPGAGRLLSGAPLPALRATTAEEAR
jgi:maleate isomerase